MYTQVYVVLKLSSGRRGGGYARYAVRVRVRVCDSRRWCGVPPSAPRLRCPPCTMARSLRCGQSRALHRTCVECAVASCESRAAVRRGSWEWDVARSRGQAESRESSRAARVAAGRRSGAGSAITHSAPRSRVPPDAPQPSGGYAVRTARSHRTVSVRVRVDVTETDAAPAGKCERNFPRTKSRGTRKIERSLKAT